MNTPEQTPRIYLDYAAATPLRNEVRAYILENMHRFANPSSIHEEGVFEREALRSARRNIARTMKVLEQEIFFVPSSTVGVNIALNGLIEGLLPSVTDPHIISSSVEHPALLETLRALEKKGVSVTYIDPDDTGHISEKKLRDAFTEKTVLVAFSLANSEIGTLLDYVSVYRTVRMRRKKAGVAYPYIFLDATQAPLYASLEIPLLRADMVVFDGGKIGSLRGAGVLYKGRDIPFSSTLFGGGQEGGFIPGTQNVLAIGALERAFLLAQGEREEASSQVGALSDYFIESLRDIPCAELNGNSKRLPHIVSVCFKGFDAEFLVVRLDVHGISVSRGSACKSGKGNESEVLRIIKPACKESSIRFSFGREITKEDIDKTINVIKESVLKQEKVLE